MARALGGLALCGLLTPALPAPAAAAPSPYVSATVCSECHHSIYDSWSRTSHALATLDPVFAESLKKAGKLHGKEIREICLMCHSPTTNLSGDFDLEQQVSREGVTCSFCHSVTGIDRSRPRNRYVNYPANLTVDPVTGSMKVHQFEKNSPTMSAEFCAGCHEWTNSEGLKVFSTYSEWKESDYASEGVSCQQCHMPKILGNDSMTEGKKTVRPMSMHFQMGGHSQDQLVSAASMTVSTKVEGNQVLIDAAITNLKAGHKMPTGVPTRKMKLKVILYDRQGQIIDSRHKVYSRVIADAEGSVLEDLTEQFLVGAREIADNRIAPKETRREQLVFTRPGEIDFILVEISLEYEILTPFLESRVLSFGIDKKRIPLFFGAQGKTATPVVSLTIIAAVFLIVTAAMVLFMRRRSSNGETLERKE